MCITLFGSFLPLTPRDWHLTYIKNTQGNIGRFIVEETQVQRSDLLRVAQDEVVGQVSLNKVTSLDSLCPTPVLTNYP
jgi:hypothetical protein